MSQIKNKVPILHMTIGGSEMILLKEFTGRERTVNCSTNNVYKKFQWLQVLRRRLQTALKALKHSRNGLLNRASVTFYSRILQISAHQTWVQDFGWDVVPSQLR